MARIAGVDLPKNKTVEYGLTAIYGVGLFTANKVCAQLGIESSVSWISVATVVSATARACPFAVSVPAPTPVPVRAPRRLWLTRRSKEIPRG